MLHAALGHTLLRDKPGGHVGKQALMRSHSRFHMELLK